MGTKECSLFPVGDTAHCLKKPTEVDRRSSSREGEGRITGIITVKQGVVFFDKGRPLYSFYTRGDPQTPFFASFPPWRLYSWRERDHLSDGLKRHVTVMIRRRDYYMDEFLVSSSSSFLFFFLFLISILWARSRRDIVITMTLLLLVRLSR